jgi:S-adenosylmethionine decarboxylase
MAAIPANETSLVANGFASTSNASELRQPEVLADDEDVNSPFEGPEKLLEIWWQDSAVSVANGKGLRRVSRDDWEEMLDLVHCKIISIVQNDCMDAYMLR